MRPDERLMQAIDTGAQVARSRTAAPEATGTAAEPNDRKESKDMAIVSGAHEEVSIDGTGISHVPLLARPVYAGLVPPASPGEAPSVSIRDGALQLVTDDLDLALAWRNAWQAAVSALVIHRERHPLPVRVAAPKPVPDYAAMSERGAVIAGLRELADFLDDHPDVPVDPEYTVQYSASAFIGDLDAAVADVDRVAAILGVEPGRPHPASPHHAAYRQFGPARYAAVAVNAYRAKQTEVTGS